MVHSAISLCLLLHTVPYLPYFSPFGYYEHHLDFKIICSTASSIVRYSNILLLGFILFLFILIFRQLEELPGLRCAVQSGALLVCFFVFSSFFVCCCCCFSFCFVFIVCCFMASIVVFFNSYLSFSPVSFPSFLFVCLSYGKYV